MNAMDEAKEARGALASVALVSVAVFSWLLASGFMTPPVDTVSPQPKMAEWRYCHPYGPGIPVKLQLPECVKTNVPKVVIWGDSFGEVWQDFGRQIAEEQGAALVRAINPGCVPVQVDLPPLPGRVSAFCRKQADDVARYIKTYGADTVILAGWWARLLREKPEAADIVKEWAKAARVRRIVVVGAVPELRDSVEKCVALGLSCDVNRVDYEAGSSATKQMTAELAKLPNVEVMELGDFMCDADKCRGVRNGVAMYYKDNHHASPAAVKQFLTSRGTRLSAE